MGVRVEYKIPSVMPVSADLAGTASWVAREQPFDRTDRRFLTVMFLPDEPGMLRRAVELLNTPITLPGAAAREVRFTIEGSVATSVADAFLLAFVVRPTVDSPIERDDFFELVAAGLVRAATDAFKEVHREEVGDLSERFPVLDFVPGDDSLFSASQFTEYRFANGSKDHREALGSAIAELALNAGSHQVPIAYTFFPTREGDAGVEQGAKIALALPNDVAKEMALEWSAVKIAARYHLRLEAYNAASSVAEYGNRFLEVGDFRKTDSEPADPSMEFAKRAIFVTGRAQPGLVGRMLSNDVGSKLIGGTMTVVGGHTVACWVGPERIGDELEEAIHNNCEGNVTIVGRRMPQASAQPLATLGDCWLAWALPDNPGKYRIVLNLFESAVTEEFGCESVVDYIYANTRVLSPSICAGKIHARILGKQGISFKEALDRTLSRIRASEGWSKAAEGRPSSRDVDLSLSETEPGEEPWARIGPVVTL